MHVGKENAKGWQRVHLIFKVKSEESIRSENLPLRHFFQFLVTAGLVGWHSVMFCFQIAVRRKSHDANTHIKNAVI